MDKAIPLTTPLIWCKKNNIETLIDFEQILECRIKITGKRRM
jgi:hypothetical protein